MGKGTRDTWPDETPDDVIDRVRREHGDRAAEVVAKTIAGPVPKGGPKPEKKTRVGRRPIVPPSPASWGIKARGLTPREAKERDWQRAQDGHRTLPPSGAGAIPTVTPRTHAQRRRPT